MKNLHIVSIFVILLINCSLLTTKSNTNKINADSHINQGNAYWGKRASPKSAKLAVLFYKKAFELNKTDLMLAASLSKAYYFQAYYVESDLSKRDTLYLKGAESALRGFENSTFYQSFSATTKFENNKLKLEAIKKAPIETIGVLFWWVNNQGKFLINKPIIDRIGSREILEVAMHRISTLDEDYYYGGPTRFFGMFYSRLPGVPLDRAKLNFDQSLLDNPLKQLYLSNNYETYLLKNNLNRSYGSGIIQDLVIYFCIHFGVKYVNIFGWDMLDEQEKAKELLNNTTILFE